MSSILQKIRTSRLRRLLNLISAREQLLLGTFVLVLLYLWGANLAERFGRFQLEQEIARSDLKSQALWLDTADTIAVGKDEALARVDASKTFTSVQLVGRVDSIARESGLNFDINRPSSDPGETFTNHNVRIVIRRAPIADLIRFEGRINELAPYLRLNRVHIAASQSNPTQLDAQFVIESFDLADPAL